MNYTSYLASLALVTASATVVAQGSPPACGTANYDRVRHLYTIANPTADTRNQQCLFTVHAIANLPDRQVRDQASALAEGNYAIELSGGGGGGGGGASHDQGGGGGGAGAAPSHVIRYLAPGTYKVTIGAGGRGGSANGGATENGSPTSLMNATTGQHIAGFPNAEVWMTTRENKIARDGEGGVAPAGGSQGGSGADSGLNVNQAAQPGGESQTSGYGGSPGASGDANNRRSKYDSASSKPRNAGGGGGAGVGDGGAGGSVSADVVAGTGDLGGGGGGGKGGANRAEAGAQGGHGFIRLSTLSPIL